MSYTSHRYINKICLKCRKAKELPPGEKFCRICETRLINDEYRYIVADDENEKDWEIAKIKLTAGYTKENTKYKGRVYHNNFKKEIIYNLKKLIKKVNTATAEEFVTFLSNWREGEELELTPGAIIQYSYIYKDTNVDETPIKEIKELLLNYLIHTLLVEQFNLELIKSI